MPRYHSLGRNFLTLHRITGKFSDFYKIGVGSFLGEKKWLLLGFRCCHGTRLFDLGFYVFIGFFKQNSHCCGFFTRKARFMSHVVL